MQLEQSGFLLSRAILSPIPKPAFIVAALVVLSILLTNAILMLGAKPKLSLHNCISKYYETAHMNLNDFLNRPSPNKTGMQPSQQQLNQFQRFLNYSQIIQFQVSGDLQPDSASSYCLVQLNYDRNIDLQPKQQQQASSSRLHTLGFMVSNYPLFNLNLSDTELLKKHSIRLNRIVLPEYYAGYRYLGMDFRASQIEDLLLAVDRDFVSFQKYNVEKWEKQLLDIKLNVINLQLKIVQLKAKQNSTKVSNTSSTQNKTSTNISSQGNTTQAHKPVQQPSNATSQPKLQLISKSQIKQPSTIRSLQQNNSTNATQLQKLIAQSQQSKQKYIQLKSLINLSSISSSYAKHRIMYRMDDSGKWYSKTLSSQSAFAQKSIIWRAITKTVFCFIIAQLLIFGFFLVGLFVRYAYIVTTSLLSIICRNSIGKHVAWMQRYLDLYKNVDQTRKKQQKIIVLQVGLSFIGMYCLYAVMAYYLSQTFQMVLVSFDIVPMCQNYLDSLFRTLLLIEISHYIFFRTRTSLSFFSKFSLLSSLMTLLIISYNPHFVTSYLLNAYFLVNLLLVICFLFIEKCIREQQFESGHRPSLQKPRLLFYFGYDLDWHRNIPPIWTFFQPWCDLSYASEHERSYIDQNYELLYGRLLGVNDPQQLPQQQDDDESASFKQIQMSQNLY